MTYVKPSLIWLTFHLVKSQTDGWTDRSAVAKTALSIAARCKKKRAAL